MKNYVSYLRVSTQKQGRTGLGIDAQRTMCQDFAERNNGTIVQEFSDIESGTHRDRKGLWSAIEFCQKTGHSLVIAKLDRLARDVEFTFKVINTGIDIHFVDMPIVNCMILGVFASVAQYERELCSKRTKAALEVKKKNGAKLGASSEKYKQTFYSKSTEEISEMYNKRGGLKREHFLESRDIKAFLRIIKNEFPDHTKDNDIHKWEWKGINCKYMHKPKMLQMIHDYKAIDSKLFRKFDGSGYDATRLQSLMYSLKRSLNI